LTSWASRKKNGDTQRFKVQQRDPQDVDAERRKLEAELSEYICARCGKSILGREIGASVEGRVCCRECVAEFSQREEQELQAEQQKELEQKESKPLKPVTITGFLKESVENVGVVIGDSRKVRNVSIEDRDKETEN
jgi:late competence protein required for DNA uptake (superfamily II DNA/RNA helicase)